jgi:hypothetical protein
MWEALATMSDGSTICAYGIPDGTIHIYEDDNIRPTDTLTHENYTGAFRYSLSPEALAETLRFWIYEFRRGEEIESVQVRYLRG